MRFHLAFRSSDSWPLETNRRARSSSPKPTPKLRVIQGRKMILTLHIHHDDLRDLTQSSFSKVNGTYIVFHQLAYFRQIFRGDLQNVQGPMKSMFLYLILPLSEQDLRYHDQCRVGEIRLPRVSLLSDLFRLALTVVFQRLLVIKCWLSKAIRQG